MGVSVIRNPTEQYRYMHSLDSSESESTTDIISLEPAYTTDQQETGCHSGEVDMLGSRKVPDLPPTPVQEKFTIPQLEEESTECSTESDGSTSVISFMSDTSSSTLSRVSTCSSSSFRSKRERRRRLLERLQ